MTYAAAHESPPPEALAAILGPTTRAFRAVEIYEEDGQTLWMRSDELGVLDGSVSVDQTRDERRAFDLVLDNEDGLIDHRPGALWYDKIIKMWRGVEFDNGNFWACQIGEFMIDSVETQDFPHSVALTGRDYTKKCLQSKFAYPTSFASGQSIESIIKQIATNAGIDPRKMILPYTGFTTEKDWYFDTDTERWKAMTDIATNYGFEIYFDGNGYMVLRQFRDPSTSTTSFTFQTGPYGTLANFTKRSGDARLYNVVVVVGESSDTIPVYGVARNTEPTSPTNIDEIGERTYNYTSQFIYTVDQAQRIANNFLAVHALEEYEVSMGTLVLPWLEVGEIVEFIDPRAVEGDPTRYLMSNFTIPMGLGTMDISARRVVRVGYAN